MSDIDNEMEALRNVYNAITALPIESRPRVLASVLVLLGAEEQVGEHIRRSARAMRDLGAKP